MLHTVELVIGNTFSEIFILRTSGQFWPCHRDYRTYESSDWQFERNGSNVPDAVC